MRRAVLSLLAICVSTSVQAAAVPPITPGEWETTVTIDSMEMPGMPAAALQKMTGVAHTMTNCVTAEDAAKGPEALLKANGGKCKFTSYDMQGNQLNSVMQCDQAPGRSMTMTSKTTYSSTTYSSKSHMEMTGGMQSSSTVTGKRLGACK